MQASRRGFNAKTPTTRRYNWGALDNAVNTVRATGMRVMLTITGPGPAVGLDRPGQAQPALDPERRRPTPTSRARSPRATASQVDRYLIWNEPNQQGWLQPQWQCDKRRRNCTAVSPHVYRSLVRAATPAIHAADPGSEVVMGELAPVGDPPISANTPIKPLIFMREMGCVDAQYRTVRSGRCKGFKAPQADSFGYHPHPLLNAPDKPNPDRDEAQFADLSRLFSVLDKLRAKKRLRVSGNIHLTEFGYQTNPPDKAVGISLAKQTTYLQQAAFVGLEVQARARAVLLPVGRRAGGQPRRRDQALLGLADGPALQRRQAQARALDVPGPVRDRAQGQGEVGAAVGPGAPGRRPDDRRADQAQGRGRLHGRRAGDDAPPTAPGRTG